MSDYKYRARHQPARRSDRFEARPGEHLASVFSILVGFILLVSTAFTSPLIGIAQLHDVVYVVVGGLLVLGGGSALVGIQWSRRTISVGWSVERTGCIIAACGWAAAAVVLTQVRPLMMFGLLVCAFLSTFYVFRLRLLNRVELQAREDTGKESP